MFTLRTLLRPHHLLSLTSLTMFVLAVSWDHGQTAPEQADYQRDKAHVNLPATINANVGRVGVSESYFSSAGKDWISLPYSYEGPSRLLLEQSEIDAIRHAWVVQPADPV